MTTEQLKELYATGEWICVTKCNGIWFIENIDRYKGEYNFSYTNRLIHKKHSEVLDHVLSGGEILCSYWDAIGEHKLIEDISTFINNYNIDAKYEILKDNPSLIILEPCPFCGSNNIDESFALQNNGYIGVGCMDCGASTECKQNKEKAVMAWNRRA